jgi:hypothetical protein
MSVPDTPARKEPSHAVLLEAIGGIRMELKGINRRFDAGEKRFDRLEEKMDAADKVRGDMMADIATLKAGAGTPLGMGWKLIAALVVLGVFAGAGLAVVAIAGVDILPKLQAIKAAVGATE